MSLLLLHFVRSLPELVQLEAVPGDLEVVVVPGDQVVVLLLEQEEQEGSPRQGQGGLGH